MMKKFLLLCFLLLSGCTQAQTTSPEIEEQQAKQIVLTHAKVEENDITKLEIEKNIKEHTNVYTITFSTNHKTYEYLVNRVNGEILKSSYETIVSKNDNETNTSKENSNTSTTNNNSTNTNEKNTPSSVQENNVSSNQNMTSNSSSPSTVISKEQAKTIALSHANVNVSDTKMFRIFSEIEDGIAIYNIEFYANNKEYDYEIAQNDGRIISYDYDIENYTPSTQTTNNTQSSIISLADAKNLVLAKVNGASEQNLIISLDYEDGKQVYEGELINGTMEYEFEIDAASGSFIEWSMEPID